MGEVETGGCYGGGGRSRSSKGKTIGGPSWTRGFGDGHIAEREDTRDASGIGGRAFGVGRSGQIGRRARIPRNLVVPSNSIRDVDQVAAGCRCTQQPHFIHAQRSGRAAPEISTDIGVSSEKRSG